MSEQAYVRYDPPVQPLFFDDNGAQALVEQGFTTATNYASSAYDKASGFLDSIIGVANNLKTLPVIDVNMLPIFTVINPYQSPVVPSDVTLNPSFPAGPAEPTIGAVTTLSVGNTPIFTAVSPVIDTNIPVPSNLSVTSPTAPDLTAIAIPDNPGVTLPSVPSLLGINIPDAPTIVAPLFTALSPIAPTDASIVPFAFTEQTYVDTLLDSVKKRLKAFVDGDSTGLDPAVEQAIFDRGMDREIQIGQTGVEEIIKSYAGKGFTMPQGAMTLAMNRAMQTVRDKISGLSRDVMIKQADLEQSNRQEAFKNAITLEGQLLTFSNSIANRAFEVAKFASEVGITMFNARIAAFAAQVQAYLAEATIFKTRLEGELAKLEVFKAQIEGQKLIGEVNLQNVQIYKTQVDAAISVIEIFKARIAAVELLTKVDGNRIEAYKSTVAAYGEQVKAKAAEYDMYATRVKAEASKVEIYKSQADAYKSEVDGFVAITNSKIQQQAAEIKYKQEAPIELFKARVSAYSQQVSAEASRLQSLTGIYESKVRAYGAQIDGESKRVGAETDTYKAEVEYKVKEATLRIEEARTNLSTLQQSVQLLLEAMRSGSTVAAQLAASAMSAVNLSANVSDSSSTSASASNSNQSQWNSEIAVYNLK